VVGRSALDRVALVRIQVPQPYGRHMFFNSVFQKPQWVLGLMSGTSADGVDGALLRVDQNGVMGFGPTLYRPYSREMQQRIVSAMGNPDFSDTELVKDITNEHVWLAKDLVEQSGTTPVLIGFHGQTLYHVPRQNGQKARTLQVGDGAQLADQLNISVVDQFRVADVEKGGEGAPLV
jgi:anhydro-N-acetylmuramic acid kinase